MRVHRRAVCIPSFILIGHCISELHVHAHPLILGPLACVHNMLHVKAESEVNLTVDISSAEIIHKWV